MNVIARPHNGRHGSKYHSARHFARIRTDTGIPTEGAACVRIFANAMVDTMSVCRKM